MQQKEIKVAIALGSNLNNPVGNLTEAVRRLRAGGLKKIVLAPFYETEPVDCVPGTPPFVNSALIGYWSKTVEQLHVICMEIEHEMGRPPVHSSRESRIIDLDLLLFDQLEIQTSKLTIPHAGLSKRLFVLAPLKDIAPDWLGPSEGKTVLDIYEQLVQQSELKKNIRLLGVAEDFQ